MLYCGLWSPALHGRMGLAARARIAMRLPPGRPFSAGPRAIARPRAAALPLLRRQPPVSRGVRFQTTLGQKIAQNRRFHFLNYMSGLIPALLLYLWYDFKYTKQEDHAGPPSRDEVLEILASGGGIVDAEGKPVDIKEAAEGKVRCAGASGGRRGPSSATAQAEGWTGRTRVVSPLPPSESTLVTI